MRLSSVYISIFREIVPGLVIFAYIKLCASFRVYIQTTSWCSSTVTILDKKFHPISTKFTWLLVTLNYLVVIQHGRWNIVKCLAILEIICKKARISKSWFSISNPGLEHSVVRIHDGVCEQEVPIPCNWPYCSHRGHREHKGWHDIFNFTIPMLILWI